jgi:hypothetical protein
MAAKVCAYAQGFALMRAADRGGGDGFDGEEFLGREDGCRGGGEEDAAGESHHLYWRDSSGNRVWFILIPTAHSFTDNSQSGQRNNCKSVLISTNQYVIGGYIPANSAPVSDCHRH